MKTVNTVIDFLKQQNKIPEVVPVGTGYEREELVQDDVVVVVDDDVDNLDLKGNIKRNRH